MCSMSIERPIFAKAREAGMELKEVGVGAGGTCRFSGLFTSRKFGR